MDELSLARAAVDAAEWPALIAGGVTYSFGELGERAAHVAAGLMEQGVGAGSRVALIAKNSVETVLAIHALIDLGATIVPVHPRLTEAEVEVVLADAAPALVLRADELQSSSAPSGERRNAETQRRRDAETHQTLGLSAPPRLRASAFEFLPAEAPLAIVYTSGTTGRPKGAVLSRRAFVASAAASAENLGWVEEDRWLCAMPLCHVGGLSILTRCLLARRAVILEPRFDVEAVLAAIVRERVTLLSVVPTMLQALLERDADDVLSRLRAVLVGGAGAPFALIEECGRRGVPALTTYGLTEACSQVTVQRLAAPYRARRGSGVPLSGVEIRIVREDGSAASQGEVGRIQVRGPTLMDGYHRGPDREPDRSALVDGWFDTGDLGEREADGTLHVHTRRSDLIVTGGENVYPLEVEQRLEATLGVKRALVFGVPDERWGQLVAAAVELAEGADLEACLEKAATTLAPHKRPRRACAVGALPLTGSGKLDRSRAAERYASALRPISR